MGIQWTLDESGIGTIEIDHPDRLNALTIDDWRSLRAHLRVAAGIEQLRELRVVGAGRSFCAGADLRTLTRLAGGSRSSRRRDLAIGNSMIKELIRFPRPTVAIVNGAAVGIGASIALACDQVVVTDTASFRFLFTRIGLPGGDMATPWLLARRVGSRRASELLLDARSVDARSAVELGLADPVEQRIGGSETAERSMSALVTTKRQILALEGAFSELDAQLERQLEELTDAVGGPEFGRFLASITPR
jgi:2-(1,2-epoxy-1,2-dihydrophenyl)acetyl-CoA isomerase